MSKRYLVMLCIIISFVLQGSALHRAWRSVVPVARNTYVRATDYISRLRPYAPRWTTSNKNIFIRPWTNRITNISKNAWTKPAVITGLAGAGLGTYCMSRNPVFAQEDVQPEVRAFLQEAQKIINSLRDELPHCTDYACANIIFNKCENLIGIVLHNEYEGVSLQGAHQSAVKYLATDILAVKKEAVAKALDFAQDKIWSMWHTSDTQIDYNQNLIGKMLQHIAHYSGASIRYNIYPQESDWVKIPIVYQRIIRSIAKDQNIKQAVLADLHNRASTINQKYDEQVANSLLDILYAIEKRLNV